MQFKEDIIKAQDWMNQDNNRSRAVSHLAELCAELGLSWSASEKQFVVTLPVVLDTSVLPTIPGKLRKTFDISKWGERGIDETEHNPLPDNFQMPDTGEILDEGEPPKGDPNAEN